MRWQLFVLTVLGATLVGLFGSGTGAQLGNGQITLRCDSSMPPADCSYIQTLFNLIYPELIRFYGRPQNTITVTVQDKDYCCQYNRESKTIEINTPLNVARGQNDPVFDAIFTHELAHAFHDTIRVIERRSDGGWKGGWIGEGMPEAVTQLVARNLQGRRQLRSPFGELRDYLRDYDTYAQLGQELLMLWCPACVHRSLPTYESAAGLFLLLTFALSSPNRLDFLARLNEQLYLAAGRRGPNFTRARFLQAVRTAAAERRIEGLNPEEWIERQPIAVDGPFVRGPHLALLPADPEDLDRIEVFAFIRESRQGYLPVDWGIGNLDVVIKVLSADSTVVLRRTVRTSNEQYEIFPGTGLRTARGNAWIRLSRAEQQAMKPGAYQIVAQATHQGRRLVARSFVLRTGLQLENQKESRYLLGATLNGQGLPVRAAVTPSAGRLVMQQNGAFIVEVPEGVTELTVTSGSARQVVLKPGPYARVLPFTVGSDAPAGAKIPLQPPASQLLFRDDLGSR